jgi:hypothetical protein
VGSRSKARARAQVSQPGANRPSAPQSAAAARRRTGAQRGPATARPGRSAAASDSIDAGTGQGQPPRTVLALAAIEAIEAAGVLLAAVIAGLDTGSGRSYHLASGIAITVIGVGTALLLGLVARGLRAGRRWTRTPALLTQLFTGIVAIYLLQAPRYDWGIPALVLALAGFAMLFAPASMQLLTPGRPDKPEPR